MAPQAIAREMGVDLAWVESLIARLPDEASAARTERGEG